MMARRSAATEPTFLTQAHAFYEPTPFCAPMTCGSRILLDSVNVKGNVVARSRSKADCRSSRRSSRTLRSRSLSSLLSLLRQRQMSFRTCRISFNRSSIEAITDAISNLNQPVVRKSFNARARSDHCFCRSSAIFATSALDFKSCHSALSGSKWLSYPNPHAARSGVRPALQLVSK